MIYYNDVLLCQQSSQTAEGKRVFYIQLCMNLTSATNYDGSTDSDSRVR